VSPISSRKYLHQPRREPAAAQRVIHHLQRHNSRGCCAKCRGCPITILACETSLSIISFWVCLFISGSARCSSLAFACPYLSMSRIAVRKFQHFIPAEISDKYKCGVAGTVIIIVEADRIVPTSCLCSLCCPQPVCHKENLRISFSRMPCPQYRKALPVSFSGAESSVFLRASSSTWEGRMGALCPKTDRTCSLYLSSGQKERRS